MNISIAIDGPAGAGKSTIAKMIGDKFNLMYINTGAMYRAVTFYAIKNNISTGDKDLLCDLVTNLNMKFENDHLYVNEEDINNELNLPIISNNVASFAAIPKVREVLIKLQRDMSLHYDVIMDGRDIGTCVLKNATFKFYLTASAETRAERRFTELSNKHIKVDYSEILNEIIKRDNLDINRKNNPLRKAEDAILIDSSNLNIEEVVEVISTYIKSRATAEV